MDDYLAIIAIITLFIGFIFGYESAKLCLFASIFGGLLATIYSLHSTL